jgi:transcriptional regulator with XRE-family HTH domain
MESSIRNYIGCKLKALRVSRGVSQQKLGDELGISFQQVRKYELGENCLTCDRLCKISGLLHAPVEYFFENIDANIALNEEKEPQKSKRNAPKPVILDKESTKLMRYFNKITDDALRAGVLNLARVYAQKTK